MKRRFNSFTNQPLHAPVDVVTIWPCACKEDHPKNTLHQHFHLDKSGATCDRCTIFCPKEANA